MGAHGPAGGFRIPLAQGIQQRIEFRQDVMQRTDRPDHTAPDQPGVWAELFNELCTALAAPDAQDQGM